MRRLIAFPCEGETLVASLDEGAGTTGLLIMSGGNEPRMGAHRGMALLAGRLGVPVFRFDRRGVGDSSGANGGWASSAPDIAAALAAFRREVPQITRLVGFGNCDAATALALFGGELNALVLANPWVVERDGDLPPPAAIRARYAARLRDPRAWGRLATGAVNIRKLARGLRAIAAPRSEAPLAGRFADAVRGREVTIALATGDATAIAYLDAVKGLDVNAPVRRIETASHSFAREGDAAALEVVLLEVLRGGGPSRESGRSVMPPA